MKQSLFSRSRIYAMCLLIALITATTGSARPSLPAHQTFDFNTTSQEQKSDKDKPKDNKPKVSGDEANAAKKINAATDAAAKLQAATEFINKYPKSTIRKQVAQVVSQQIADLKDPAQKITLAEKYLGVFTEAGEDELIIPVLIDSYVAANRLDDAFKFGATWIERHPDDVDTRRMLAIIGTDQAQRNNPKLAQQSQQYGLKAIELIEADKKPAMLDAGQWATSKKWLPQLYQALGVLAFMSGKPDEAKARLEKSAALDPSNPLTFALMGNMLNDQYQQMTVQYKSMPAGAARDEFLKKINAQIDQVIDLYAHAVALSAGNAQLQKLHDQLLQDLQSYYKYRHKDSTDGLQQLIDKYKKSPTPQ